MATRELPEIRFAGKKRLMEKELAKQATEQDKKSTLLKRQIDRNIYLTAKELSDIQTRTSSPSRGGFSPRPMEGGSPRQRKAALAGGSSPRPVEGGSPRQRKATPASRAARPEEGGSPRQRKGALAGRATRPKAKPAPPHITVSADPEGDDSDHVHSPRAANSSDCDSDSDTHLVHLRARTRRNMLLSQKLSRSLEVMDERREMSPRPPPSASPERRPYRPVSSRSMESLEKAVSVLRFTEHEERVQHLLSTVSLKAPDTPNT